MGTKVGKREDECQRQKTVDRMEILKHLDLSLSVCTTGKQKHREDKPRTLWFSRFAPFCWIRASVELQTQTARPFASRRLFKTRGARGRDGGKEGGREASKPVADTLCVQMQDIPAAVFARRQGEKRIDACTNINVPTHTNATRCALTTFFSLLFHASCALLIYSSPCSPCFLCHFPLI